MSELFKFVQMFKSYRLTESHSNRIPIIPWQSDWDSANIDDCLGRHESVSCCSDHARIPRRSLWSTTRFQSRIYSPNHTFSRSRTPLCTNLSGRSSEVDFPFPPDLIKRTHRRMDKDRTMPAAYPIRATRDVNDYEMVERNRRGRNQRNLGRHLAN
jgi:hypothetical protein